MLRKAGRVVSSQEGRTGVGEKRLDSKERLFNEVDFIVAMGSQSLSFL